MLDTGEERIEKTNKKKKSVMVTGDMEAMVKGYPFEL